MTEEHGFSVEFICEVYVRGTVYIKPKNDIKLLIDVLPLTPVEHANQYSTLLPEKVSLFSIDLLTDAEIEIESKLEGLG